jgi:hypothetical protein
VAGGVLGRERATRLGRRAGVWLGLPLYRGAGLEIGGDAVLVSRPGTPWPWRRARMGFSGLGCRAGADRVGRKGL